MWRFRTRLLAPKIHDSFRLDKELMQKKRCVYTFSHFMLAKNDDDVIFAIITNFRYKPIGGITLSQWGIADPLIH